MLRSEKTIPCISQAGQNIGVVIERCVNSCRKYFDLRMSGLDLLEAFWSSKQTDEFDLVRAQLP